MATLKADLGAKLEAGPLATQLLSDIGGPLAALQGLTVPAAAGDASAVSGIAGPLDLGPLGGALTRLSGGATGVLQGLPAPGDVLTPLTSAVELVESVTTTDLAGGLKSLVERLGRELSGRGAPGQEGSDFLGLLQRFSALLTQAPELQGVLDLLGRIVRLTGVQVDPAQLLGGNPLPTVIGTVRALAALMSVESSLAEGERLTTIMAHQLDADQVTQDFAALRVSFDVAAEKIARATGSTPPDGAVDDAEQALVACAGQLATLQALLARNMGFGEATLVQLDLTQLDADLEGAVSILRTVDADAIGRTVHALLDRLTPVLHLELPGAAAATLDELLALVESKVGEIAGGIGAIAVTPITAPLQAGLAKVTGVLQQVSAIIARITATLRGALDAVRQAVAALPFDEIASAVRTVLAPIGQAMDAVRQLVAGIQDALGTLATAVTGALHDAEGFVDTFQANVEALLKGAADFMDSLHLDQVVGSVADGVNAFADTLAKAQMKPYFDTAVNVIDDTASVIGAVPLSLLPDSMKADLDAAVAPIKAIDVEQVKTEVESWFDIVDGKFTLRKPIEDALVDLQAKYDELIAAVESADPRQLVDPINTELAKIAQQVGSLTPQLTLKPIQDAIDQVKGGLGAFDLRQQLQPVTAVFDQIVAAIDQYSPEHLIQPIEERVTAAREKIVADIHLRDWSGQLDDLKTQALTLLDRVDPARLQPALEESFAELDGLLAQLDGLHLGGTLGDVVASFVSGSGLRVHPWTLQVVVGWLTGAPGRDELGAHAEAMHASIAATQAGVQAADTRALSVDLSGRLGTLRTAIAALPEGSDGRSRLSAALDRVRPDVVLPALSANRDRYLQELGDALAQADTLRRRGLSEVSQTVTALTSALSPMNALKDFFGSLLAQIGIRDTSIGLAGVVRQILAAASPERLANIFVPLFQALRGRIVALLNGVLDPLKQAIAQLIAIVDAIDLAPLRQGVHDIVAEVKSQILAISPEQLLAPTLTAFDLLKADLLAFDPLKDIRALLDALQQTVVRVLAKLDANKLLAQPIRIYDDIVNALKALSLDTLLAPVLDQLDNLAGQVSSGLDGTAGAIERLQAALPEPGGSPAGALAGAAVSVGGDLGF